jgi:hypothetical protein
MPSRIWRALGVLVFFAVFVPPLVAQFTTVIEGTVTDPSGAGIPDAEVVVENQDTGVKRTVRTSDSGFFRAPSLPAGTYRIQITAQGFESQAQENVLLQSDQIKTLSIQLKVGTSATTVTVAAEVPLVETGEAKVSGHIQEREVKDLPLVGRNFMNLVVLTPGVTGVPGGAGQAYAQATGDIFAAEYGVNLNANGQRAESNNFLVDSASVNGSPRGGVSNFSPSADSVQELRVSVNNFSAEWGRNSSALVNAITKSGTNEYHGTAGWYHTNNQLSARNSVFQPQVPVFRRNQMNGTIGGPIIKNRLFGFGSVDVLRSGVGQGFSAGAITPEFASIIQQRYPNNISAKLVREFPNQLTRLSDGLYAGPVAGVVPNVGACAGSTPVNTPIGPLPCNMPLTFNGTFAETLPRNGLQWFGRIDNTWNEGNDRIYGSIGKTTLDTTRFGTPSVYPAFTAQSEEYTMYWNVNYTHVFSPTLLNETRYSGTRAWGNAPLKHGEIPDISVPGIANYGTGFSDAIFIQNNMEWSNVTSMNRGAHSFKFGGILQCGSGCPGAGALFHNVYTRPNYGFNNLYDFVRDDAFSQGNIGFDPRTGQSLGPDFRPVFINFGIFAQNDWKVRPNLTFTFGLRWETFLVPWDHDNIFVHTTYTGGTDFSSRIAGIKPEVGRPHTGTDWNNFAPRVGIAWDPTNTGRMSIRAGFGVFFDRPAGQFYSDSGTSLPVFATAAVSKQTDAKPVYGLSSTLADPWNFPRPPITVGLNSFNGLIGIPANLPVWDPNMRTQYAFNYFFGIQRSFGRSWVVEGNYVGSQGRKLYMSYNVNRYAGDLFDGRLDRISPNFGTIDFGQANAGSTYQGGNLAVRKRLSMGLNLQAAYTFGKAIDYASSFGRGLGIVDNFNLSLNRGLSDFDIRQKFALSLLYETPSFGSGWRRALFGDWQIGAVTILQSGRPFSVNCTGGAFAPVRDANGNIVSNNGCDYNADGLVNDFPNAPSFGGYLSFDKQQYLNGVFRSTDFTKPTPGTPGTLARNAFYGPGYANTNLNILKRFPLHFLGERGRFEFRAEFFNLFNRTNLQNPVGNLADGNFGRSTTAFGGRNVQFGIKVIF